MGNVQTNRTAQAFCEETSIGVAGTTGDQLGPNSYGDFGADIRTVARNPISANNQREAGTIVDLDAKASIEADATMDHIEFFIEGAIRRSLTGATKFRPTAVTATGYTVPSGGAIPDGRLVFARGFGTAANNGLKLLAGTSTGTEVKTTGLVAEPAPPSNAILEVCGVQGASGDIRINAGGNLTSIALDFTTLGLVPGQMIHIGDEGAAYQFGTLADHGFARVVSVATNLITLDKRSQAFTTDNGAGKTIRIFFGRFTKVCPSTDGNYVDKTYQVEVMYPGLGAAGATRYEYAKGLVIDEFTVVIPQTDKATMTVSMIGTDVEAITAVRKTFGTNARAQTKTVAINTTSDIGRMRVQKVDETGLTTYLKSATLRIRNSATPNKAIGLLGSVETTKGLCEVDVDWQGYFTNEDVVAAARNNTAITYDLTIRNNDGAVVFDIPEARLGSAKRDFPVNELVQVSSSVAANRDATYNTSLSVSLFPYCPPVRTS